jgi:hypothetical protein
MILARFQVVWFGKAAGSPRMSGPAFAGRAEVFLFWFDVHAVPPHLELGVGAASSRESARRRTWRGHLKCVLTTRRDLGDESRRIKHTSPGQQGIRPKGRTRRHDYIHKKERNIAEYLTILGSEKWKKETTTKTLLQVPFELDGRRRTAVGRLVPTPSSACK